MIPVRTYWLMQGMRDVPEDDAWLNEDERARLGAISFQKRRDEWRLGRWTAKQAVTTYLAGGEEIPHLSTLEIRAAPNGAPEVFVDREAFPVSVSISHSSGFCLCALAGAELSVGCDLEVVRPRSEQFIADYFTREEQELLRRVAPVDEPLFATLIWSAKESALKVVRQGLRRDTRSMVVVVDPESTKSGWKPVMIHCAESTHRYPGWWLLIGDFILVISTDAPTSKPVQCRVGPS